MKEVWWTQLECLSLCGCPWKAIEKPTFGLDGGILELLFDEADDEFIGDLE